MEIQNQEKEGKRCVQINKCPSTFSLFNSQPLSALAVEFFERSDCEYDESRQLLCCMEPATQVSDISADNDTFDLTNHPKARLLPLQSCGLDRYRIWEGSVTKLDEFPWLALVYLEKDENPLVVNRVEYSDERKEDIYDCGGVLISKRYVLGVADCFQDAKPKMVQLGEYDLRTDPDHEVDLFSGRQQYAPPVQNIGVERVILHPEGEQICHNIALIRLDQDAVLETKYVMPICLPTHNVEIGRDGVLAGWGEGEAEWEFGLQQYQTIKVKVEMPVVDLKECFEEDEELWCDSQYLLCTDGINGKGTGFGDIGMPLMLWTDFSNGKRRYSVAGLASFTNGITGPQHTFYTNVFGHLPWILEMIEP